MATSLNGKIQPQGGRYYVNKNQYQLYYSSDRYAMRSGLSSLCSERRRTLCEVNDAGDITAE